MKKEFLLLTLFFSFAIVNQAQQIVFDYLVKAGNLTLFPEINNPNNYYYIPDKIQIGRHPDNKPQFSFIRYVKNTGPSKESPSTSGFSESNDAGGILHALVMIQVPKEDVQNAQRELTRINSNGKILGPIIYKSGKVALISSIIGSDGTLTKKVVGIGNAPILEGGKAAVSVLLSKLGADLLWATFQTPTPDLSFQFEMDAKGFQAPKRVLIEADFDQMYRHNSIEIAAVTPVFAGEIKSTFDDLQNKGAIKLTQIGEDNDLNKLKETAYNQLTNLMFDKVGSQGVGDLGQLVPNQQQSMLDRASQMLQSARKEVRESNEKLELQEDARLEKAYKNAKDNAKLSMDSAYKSMGYSNNPFAAQAKKIAAKPEELPKLAIAVSFILKTVHRSGKYSVDLNKYTEETKTFPFAENVGSMYQTCQTCFTNVNLDDPLYRQRDIFIRPIGIESSDFDGYISNVEVTVRKTHENNEITIQNIIIDKNTFNNQNNNFAVQYGWKGDQNRNKWLNYEYKYKWQFSNGLTVEIDWKKETNGVLSLIPPLVKKEISIEIDPDLVTQENIRAAEVKLYSLNPGMPADNKNVNFKISDQLLSKSIDMLFLKNINDFEYEVTWFIKGKDPVKQPRKKWSYNNIYLEKL